MNFPENFLWGAATAAGLGEDERWDLARALKRLLMGYDALFDFSLSYVIVMHQASTDGENHEGVVHFHVEFYPPNRAAEELKYLAGSEVGTGDFVVDVLPESTATALREAAEEAQR